MGRHEDLDGNGIADAAEQEMHEMHTRAAFGLTAETLRTAMGASLSLERYRALLPAFTSALIQAGCTTVNRAAMFCAQIGHESVGLKYAREIASGEAYEGRRDLGNVYPGDGPRFKGAGWLQVTGRANFTAVSRWAHEKGYVPTATYFVDHPDELASDRYVWIGPVWYWTVARTRLNSYADAGDLIAATKAINGGTNGLADRTIRWNACLKLGAALLPSTTSTFVARKVLLDMPERAFPAGDSGGRIVCPTGKVSALVGRSWFSASVDGNASVEVWAQVSGGGDVPAGAADDTAAHRRWQLRRGDRAWFELPDGTEFVTYHVAGASGPGGIAVEQLPK